MCGSLEQHRHLGASDVRAIEKCPHFRHRPAAPRRAPPRPEGGCVPCPHGGRVVPQQLTNGGGSVAGGGGRGVDFPAGQARAHRNVANDSKTKFPISGKDLLGWLMHCCGLELGFLIFPRHV
ncbi:hypothetical protein J1N35_046169 [Gossypium stocksii]|uniref:Uncharacterized protein n=1 Tax=Gossypium stocksii TaxID=47602 RepID=A0A9D3U5E7_9ROSI|nr:hypothetical protein J1N35_046169 [Gossypium stocksii]